MRKVKYILALYFMISFIFWSCKDPLAIDDLEKIGASNFLPVRNLSYYSVEIYWTEYTSNDFERYEVYYKKVDDKNYNLYIIIKNRKILLTPVIGLQTVTTYEFYIKVVDKKGNYADSKSIYVKTYSDTPSPLKYFYFDYINYNGKPIAAIIWEPYKDTNIIAFSRYDIYYSKIKDFIPSPETFFESINMVWWNFREINFTRFDKTHLIISK